jgi:hypothetical protein
VRTQIPFNRLKREELDIIDEIATRALDLARDANVRIKKQEIVMDIAACHLVACPLDLYRMLVADAGNFGHDVFGIRKHLNRESLQMMDCFIPRFARVA